jgi:Ser-tRNA(Ala) deacylase AlaX
MASQAGKGTDRHYTMKKEIDPRMHSAEHILNQTMVRIRMHSAEHILNQTMVRILNCGRSFNAHIEKKKSKCDYHFDRALTEQEITAIENQVNDVIRADMPVTEEYLPRGASQQRYDLDRLPNDAGDEIRIVKIGDYDACPCIGPHVNSTKEIGTFRIVSAGYENGMLRVRFKLAQPAQQ